MKLYSNPPLITLTVLSLVSTVHAAVVRHCTGFEGQLGQFTPILTVNIDSDSSSTVLISHINDFDIPLVSDMDLDVTVGVHENWYPLTKDIVNGTRFNESIILNQRQEFTVINTELHPGEDAVVYNATYAGVYCAVVYQEGDSVEGLHVTSTHLYGYRPLTELYWVNSLTLVLVVCLLHYLAIPWLFQNLHEDHLNATFGDYLKYALIGKFYVAVPKVIITGTSSGSFPNALLSQLNWDHVTSTLKSSWSNPWFMMNHLLSVVVITLLYRVAVGLFSFGKHTDCPYSVMNKVILIISIELMLMPSLLPMVSHLPMTIHLYSLASDLEAALYGLFVSMGAIGATIPVLADNPNGEGSPNSEYASEYQYPTYDKTMKAGTFVFTIFWSVFVSALMIPVSRVLKYEGSASYYCYEIYRFKDPVTSYNYVIMWNFVCNGVLAFPGFLLGLIS